MSFLNQGHDALICPSDQTAPGQRRAFKDRVDISMQAVLSEDCPPTTQTLPVNLSALSMNVRSGEAASLRLTVADSPQWAGMLFRRPSGDRFADMTLSK